MRADALLTRGRDVRRPALVLRPRSWAGAIALAAMATLAVVENVSVGLSQFHGEDEPEQAAAVARIAYSLSHFDGLPALARIGEVVVSAANPPLRYLLSLPGWALSGQAEWGLRLGAILFSLLMVALVAELGGEVGGPAVGYVSGLLVAGSGVFVWTSLAFGWSVIVVAIIAMIRELRTASLDLREQDERRRVLRLSAWTVLAVLTNTGAILFFVALVLVYACANARRVAAIGRAFAPGVVFYGCYYVFFVYLAPWALSRYWHGRVGSGQFGHGQARVASISPNLTAFATDLRGVSAYVLPFAGIVLLALAVVRLLRAERRVLLLLAPFALAWAFLMHIDTQQYFLLVAIPILPYGIAEASRLLGGAATPVFAVVVAATVCWSITMFVVRYPETRYPAATLTALHAEADRIPNTTVPIEQIRRLVDRTLEPGDRYLLSGHGELPAFYLKRDSKLPLDPRFAGQPGSARFRLVADPSRGCATMQVPAAAHVRLVITASKLCAPKFTPLVRFDDSTLVAYVVPR